MVQPTGDHHGDKRASSPQLTHLSGVSSALSATIGNGMLLQGAEDGLTFYSSWASIISLAVSIVSLVLVGSIRSNIIRFRRRQRVIQLIDEVLRIPDDAIPLGTASKGKLSALKRNIPVHLWSQITEQGRVAVEVHRLIDECKINNDRSEENLASLKEVIADWRSFTEDK